jgi:hypothetical protein
MMLRQAMMPRAGEPMVPGALRRHVAVRVMGNARVDGITGRVMDAMVRSCVSGRCEHRRARQCQHRRGAKPRHAFYSYDLLREAYAPIERLIPVKRTGRWIGAANAARHMRLGRRACERPPSLRRCAARTGAVKPEIARSDLLLSSYRPPLFRAPSARADWSDRV